MRYTTVGVDIAKNVFQRHWVDADTGEIVNRQLKRAAFLEHFANRELCLIGMEACGGAQHWARRLVEMGHQVKLMPAKPKMMHHRWRRVGRFYNDRLDCNLSGAVVTSTSRAIAQRL